MSLGNRYVTLQEATDLVRKVIVSENVEVVHIGLEPFSSEKLGYVGDHKLLSIDVRDVGQGVKKLTFFIKTVLPNCNSFESLVFLEELQFFRDVVPKLMEVYEEKPWGPYCYFTKEDCIILEDLRAQGFKTISATLTIDQLKASIISVALFHASSLKLEKKFKKALNQIFPNFAHEKVFINDGGLAWKWLETGIEVVETIADDLGLDSKYALLAYQLMLDKIKPEIGGENVLCHNDLWSNNFMFKEINGSTVCRLVDFQMISYTSFAVDLVQLLHLNTKKDMRLRVEEELIKLYHSVLQKVIGESNDNSDEILSLQKIIEKVKQKKICGLVTAVQFFPIALLNKNLSEEYTKNLENFHSYMYTSRKDFIVKAMQIDDVYRIRLQEAVRELIDFMVDLENSQ